MYTNFAIQHHKKLLPTLVKLHNGSFFSQSTTKTPPSSHQIHHSQALVTPHRQSQRPRGVDREIIHSLFVHVLYGFQMDKRVGVVDDDSAVIRGGDEVPREGEGGGRRGEEAEGSDAGGVVKRADLGAS